MTVREFGATVREFRDEVPDWVIGVVLMLFATSLAYGLLVRRSLLEPLAWWLQVLELALFVLAVYLFYRFVVAVETIAAKM